MIGIDLVYLIPLAIILIVGLAVWLESLNLWVGIMGIMIAFGVSYWIAGYQALVLVPLANSVWYGFSWGLLEYLAIVHLFSLALMVVIAIYNLYMSGGRKLWA